jgi:hypothetical protein
MAPLPVELLEAADEAPVAVPDGVTVELELVELEALARARKFAKVLLPVSGALIAKTIPWAQ